MKINMSEWALEIIKAKDVRNMPVLYFPCLPEFNLGIIETVNDGKKMAAAMAKIIEKYPKMIAATTGMDLSVDSEAFGSVVTFKDNEAPSVRDALIETAEEINALQVPDVHSGRVDVFIEAVTEAQKLITDRPIFGGQFGPFSLAANLLEVQAALKMTRKNPEALHQLLAKATEFLIARAKAYKAAGANGIFVAEPTAGLLSPKQLDAFSSVYVKQLVDAVQDDYFFVVLHDCGQVTKSVTSMYNTGAKGFHYGNSVKMPEILAQTPPDVLVFGNIDPSEMFTHSTPENMREVTLELLKAVKDYPHFVLSSGCDIPPSAKIENIDAYFQACVEYNQSL
ncbi:MAG: uroporphyrinogen decarboxylase family protein [bacterium]